MAASLTIIGSSACGGQSQPAQPVMIVNPWSYNDPRNPNLVAKIGTSQPEAFQIQNHGESDLKITSVTISPGDGIFTLAQPAPAGPDGGPINVIPTFPQTEGLILFYFNPMAEKVYRGTIKITSNASNDGGVAVLELLGIGCLDGGMGDGGFCAVFDGG